MMKKILLLASISLLCWGCNNSSTHKEENKKEESVTTDSTPKPHQVDELQKEVYSDTSAKPISHKEIKVEVTPDGKKLNDVARLIAGLPADTSKSDLDSFRKSPGWKKFSMNFGNTWYYALSKRLKPMVKWRTAELADVNKDGLDIFYPFSGPDFMNVFTFFPSAKTYTMLALEKPGGMPDMTQFDTSEFGGYLNSVQKSMKDILILSFFKTLSMKKDLDKNNVNGTIPLLSVFIVRTGNRILSMEKIRISGEGKIVEMGNDTSSRIMNQGVRITFKTAKGEVKEIFYFSADISNGGMSYNKGLKKYLAELPEVNTYLKSASYLMHYDNFSYIRNFILNQSKNVLQDDSGIAFKFFETDKWNFHYYGKYKKPIAMFKKREQPDLREAYKKDSAHVGAMPFPLGYNFSDKESLNLMLANKKK